MEIQKYLAILRRRKWVILVTTVVTMIVVIAGTFLATPIYSATAMLRIASAATGTVNYADYMYADRLLNTYVTISTSKLVLDELQQRLNLETLPEIEVSTIPNSELIQITVNDQDPNRAAAIANNLADIMISQSTELYTGGGKSSLEILSNQLAEMEDEVNQVRKEYVDLVTSNPDDTEKIQAAKQTLDLKQNLYADLLDQYEQTRLNEALRSKSISIVEPAFPPLDPSKPNKLLNIALGFLVGGIGGVGLAFLFENLDTTLYTQEQIEDITGLPFLGMVPEASIQNQFISSNGSNPYIEAFRQLRTSIFMPERDKRLSTLLVTSPECGEGKSTIVTNLAISLAQSGRKVIILDCDLRAPNQHKNLNLSNNLGLSNVLVHKLELEKAIQKCGPRGPWALTSGPLPKNPAELLDSPEMSDIIEQARQIFDVLLIDTPAILGVTDGLILAPNSDGVILVVSRARSHKDDVLASYKLLQDLNARVIGFVINRAERTNRFYYYHKPRKNYIKSVT